MQQQRGIADGGEDGYSNEHKRISQQVKTIYIDKSPHRICHLLAKDAEAALPELKSICAYIDNKLGMQTMAVGSLTQDSSVKRSMVGIHCWLQTTVVYHSL